VLQCFRTATVRKRVVPQVGFKVTAFLTVAVLQTPLKKTFCTT